jgi:hypothetical protein
VAAAVFAGVVFDVGEADVELALTGWAGSIQKMSVNDVPSITSSDQVSWLRYAVFGYGTVVPFAKVTFVQGPG